MNDAPRRCELRLPDLGLRETPVQASLWLVEVGARVNEGDRLLEVVAGAATVDLPAPATGILADVFVGEDEPAGRRAIAGHRDGRPARRCVVTTPKGAVFPREFAIATFAH